jgi:hypothetical protein
MSRAKITIAVGSAVAAVGAVVFLAAHAIASPASGYNPAHRDLHETLWCALAIALVLGGIAISAVGLSAWCRGGGA